MTRHLRRTLRGAAASAAAVGLVAGALLATGAASASASPRSTSAAPLDHFLCYQARSTGIKPNPNTLLKNQLQPALFAPNFLASPSWHCNPANKSVPTHLYLAKNPLAHLYCMAIEYPFKGATVLLTNQFGKAVMTVGLPQQFCLPSWKSNVAPPNQPVPYPPGLDHFTCYPLKAVAASYGFRPPTTKVEDEFSAPKYVGVKLGVADRLCVPTTKIVAGVVYPPQSAADLSLVCFPTSPTPLWKVVFDQNQFGTAVVYPSTTLEQLCLPSTMSVQALG